MPHYKKRTNFEVEKYETKKIAKDLCYGKDVLKKIDNETTSRELDRIMYSARNNL